jgi:hypothetical protein
MTNLNKLIEQRKGEFKEISETYIKSGWDEINNLAYKTYQINWNDNQIDFIAQTATLSYRQALEDVLAGLPEEDTIAYGYESGRAKKKAHNIALQTVRAQIEGLLGNIKDI